MPERLMDVHLELDRVELARTPDPTRTIAELSRHSAEAQAAELGATLRHPDPREVFVQEATTPFGLDVFLVATRWVVDSPAHA